MAHPEADKYLNGLAETLLRGPSSLTPAERAVIAGSVSAAGGWPAGKGPHAAAGWPLAGPAPVSEKLKALLVIAAKVQQGGRHLTDEDLARARQEGADDKAIHDAVLIAAAFCMFDRYEAAVYGRLAAGRPRSTNLKL
jgi:hypothetical protein